MKILVRIILTLAILGILWWLVSPLFINRSVEEALPFNTVVEENVQEDLDEDVDEDLNEGSDSHEVDSRDDTSPSATDEDLSDSNNNNAGNDAEENSSDDIQEEDMIIDEDVVVNEDMPMDMSESNEPSIERRGTFSAAANRYNASGNLLVVSDEDQTFLRFENFSVSNGPDLFITLNTGDSARGEHVIIAPLKGNQGTQNYDVSGYDLSQYESVSVYCRAFSSEFATASL